MLSCSQPIEAMDERENSPNCQKKFDGTVPRVKRDILLEQEMTVKEVGLQQFLDHRTRFQC